MSNPALLANVADLTVSRWLVSYAVNALWQVPMVAAVAWGVSRMVRRTGPRAEHMVWVGALLLMVALPAVPRHQWPHHDTATVTMVTDDYDLSALPPMQPVAQPWWVPEVGLATLPRDLVMTLLLAYFGAGLYFALRLGWSFWRTGVLVRDAEVAEFAPQAEEAWERCRQAFGLGEVRRLVSGEISCPVTVGRATVLVPAGFVESAKGEELLTAMAHECAHLRRRDFWKNVAYELATLPVAFHPMLWMVKRQIAETREMVCDGAAVERVVTPQSYVRSLLRLAEGVVGPMGLAAMGMFDGRTLERRIVSMKMRRNKMSWGQRVMVLSAALFAGVAVILGGASLAVAVEAAPNAASQQVGDTASQQVSESASQPTIQQEPVPVASSGHVETAPAQSADSGLQVELVNRRLSEKQRAQQQEALAQELQQILQKQKAAHAEDGAGPVAEQKQLVDELNAKVKELLPQVSEQQKALTKELAQRMQQNASLYRTSAKDIKEYEAKVEALLRSPDSVVAEYRNFRPLEKEEAFRSAGGYASLGSVNGRVMEQSGKAVEGALVTASNLATKVQTSVPTDGNGGYALSSLPGGPYGLNVKVNGVVRWSAGPMMLGASGQPLRMDVRLQPRMYWAAQTHEFAVPDGIRALPAQAANVAAKSKDAPQRISAGVAAGSKISGDDPVYPPIARAAHVSGAVLLHAVISKAGTVEDLSVISGPQMLQNAALNAVRTWKFKPYLVKSAPTEVETTVTVNFSMNDGTPQSAAGGVMGSVGVSTPVPAAAQSGDHLNRVSGGIIAGTKIGGDEPAYPPIARAAHITGVVVLHVVLSKAGTVKDISVIAGPQMLQNAAIEAVRTWRYRPYVLAGQSVEVDTTVTVNFSMNGDGAAPPPQGASAGGELFRIGGGVSAPAVLRSVEPEFSDEAKRAVKENKFDRSNVVVYLIVDAQGRPQNVHVMKSVGLGLDEQAVAAVKQYLFRPAMKQGQPVPVELSIEVDFQRF